MLNSVVTTRELLSHYTQSFHLFQFVKLLFQWWVYEMLCIKQAFVKCMDLNLKSSHIVRFSLVFRWTFCSCGSFTSCQKVLQWVTQPPLNECITFLVSQKSSGSILKAFKVWIDGYESEHLIYQSACSFLAHTVPFISPQTAEMY